MILVDSRSPTRPTRSHTTEAPSPSWTAIPRAALFLSWAAIWQAKVRTEMLLQRMATDPHSPVEFRCNQIVRNLPEFYAAFDVPGLRRSLARRGPARQDLVAAHSCPGLVAETYVHVGCLRSIGCYLCRP